jgi:NADPH:quinone reductase-like Zn-dependent oxidoreductase
MIGTKPADGLQLQSNAKSSGVLELALVRAPVPDPAPDEVVIRIEATPINPSDLGLLLGAADASTARAVDTDDTPVTTLDIPPAFMRAIAARIDQALPVGNEGAGVVVAAGDDAKDLLGKTVALAGGAMYAQYRVAKAAELMVLPDGVSAVEGASPFVNPMTALAMVETMRMEGHKALIHTAAASNLGQMLVKLCIEEGVDLVNIVRSTEQAALLRGIGAKYVLDSTAPDFMEQLVEALKATNATIAFDAIGGGKLASQLLTAMEQAANAAGGAYSRYGSNTYKQVYIYGGLSTGPTELTRAFGFAWGLGGFLLTPFLAKIGPEGVQRLRARVAAGLKTTFASRYSHQISLAEALDPATIAAYNKKATGEKYLIVPTR